MEIQGRGKESRSAAGGCWHRMRRRAGEWIDDPDHASDMRMIELLVLMVIGTWVAIVELQAHLPDAKTVTGSGIFITSVVSFVANTYFVLYLFCRRRAQSDRAKLLFGVLLVVSASVSYLSLEQLSAQLTQAGIWWPFSAWPLNFAILASTVKNVIGFGFGAIGAGVVSSVITRHSRDAV